MAKRLKCMGCGEKFRGEDHYDSWFVQNDRTGSFRCLKCGSRDVHVRSLPV